MVELVEYIDDWYCFQQLKVNYWELRVLNYGSEDTLILQYILILRDKNDGDNDLHTFLHAYTHGHNEDNHPQTVHAHPLLEEEAHE